MTIERIELPKESRRKRYQTPRYIVIHTTQGVTTAEKQYAATINWFKQRGGLPASEGWGPSADILIGADGREAFFTLDGQDFHATRANWAAGFGDSQATTYGVDECGIAIEIAQTSKGERPTDAALRAAIARCAYLCIQFGIEPRRIPFLAQRRGEPIPVGIVGHEDTANGRKTGKWDPNAKTFPWDWFIAEIKAEVARRTAPPVTLTAHQQQVVDWLRSDEGQLLSRANQQAILVQAGLPANFLATGSAPSTEVPKPPPVTKLNTAAWAEFWNNGAEPLSTENGRHYYRVWRKAK